MAVLDSTLSIMDTNPTIKQFSSFSRTASLPKVYSSKDSRFKGLELQRISLIVGTIHWYRDNSMKFIVTAIPESGESTNGRIDDYIAKIDDILDRIGSKVDGNVVSFRRLGKSMSQSGERRKCRPLLITCENPHLLSRSFARCFKLQDNKHPVYLKKFLSSSELEIEKKTL